MDGEDRVEQVGKMDALGFGDETEHAAVSIEAPGPALLDQVEAGFIAAIEQFVGDLAGRGLVGQLQGLGTEPADVDDDDQAVGQQAADGGIGLKIFEADHFLP